MSDTSLHSEQARQPDELVRQSGRAFQQAGDSIAETMQRGADVASETMVRTADTQNDILSKANHELTETSRKIIDASRSNAEKVRTLMTLPKAAEGGLQDMQRSVVGLVESVMRTNLTLMEEMFRVKGPQACIDLQQRFVREYLDGLLDGVTLLVRATRRTADETLRPLEQRAGHRED